MARSKKASYSGSVSHTQQGVKIGRGEHGLHPRRQGQKAEHRADQALTLKIFGVKQLRHDHRKRLYRSTLCVIESGERGAS